MASDDRTSVPLDELAGRAGRLHVAVVGGGVAGLVAALECAKVGLHVTVFEADDRLGGVVRTVVLDGIPVDVGADGFAGRGNALARLAAEVGLSDAVVAPDDTARRVWGVPGATGPVPLPSDAVLGIPENVWSDAVRRVLGTAGTWRAYVDRLRPPLTIGHEHSLGRLVRSRLGEKALQRLVAPVTTGVFFTDPDDIDVDVAAPGLNAALTRAGSLTGAVGMLRGRAGAASGTETAAAAHAARPAEASPGPAPASAVPSIRGVAGGMSRLVDALQARLQTLGAVVRRGRPVSALERLGAHGWIVHTPADEFDVTDEGPERFDGVIVATGDAEARRLLADVVPDLTAPAASAVVHIVTLVVDAPGLDEAPTGAEVVAVPGTRQAVSAVHVDARWGGVARAARAAAPGRHVVRVTFASVPARSPSGGHGSPPVPPPAAAALSVADATALACTEASAFLGVELAADTVRAMHRATFAAAPPRALIGHASAVDRVRAAVAAVPGLAVAGAWLSGSGLAQVVPDAVQTAEALRRRVLFGDVAGSDRWMPETAYSDTLREHDEREEAP